MKTAIFYFSATGNSLKVARDLANELGNTELISILTINKKYDISADRFGIVFPVYAWGLPLIVVEFIKNFKPIIKPKYFFAVATCGGSTGKTLVQLRDLLRKTGIHLNSGFKIQMPGNYVPLYDICSPQTQKKSFDNEKMMINHISAIIKDEKEFLEIGFPLTNWILSGIFYPLFASHVKLSDKKFWVTENCNGCGICKKVCPASNIELKEKKPVWLHKCEQCMACLHWCPEKAIQFAKSTIKRNRYHHPDIKLTDIILR